MESLTDFGFDVNKFKLGKLCKGGHEYLNTGKSIRLKDSSRACPTCKKAYLAEKYQNNKEIILAQQKIYYQENREYVLDRVKKYSDDNRAAKRVYGREHYQKNRVEIRAKDRERYKNDPEYRKHKLSFNLRYQKTFRGSYGKRMCFHRLRSGRYQTSSQVSYNRKQLVEHLQSFGTMCVYCNQTLWNTVDHFYAISKGGSNELHNLVPACLSCNSRKNAKDPIEWFKSTEYFNLDRLKTIVKKLLNIQNQRRL